MCYEGKEHGSVTADNKGAWPRLRVRAGFSEEVMPEPRSIIDHLLCAEHCSKHFTIINLFKPHNSPTR